MKTDENDNEDKKSVNDFPLINFLDSKVARTKGQ